MNLTATLLLLFAGAIPVEATTLDGVTTAGELSELTGQAAIVTVDGAAQQLPFADLHELRLRDPATQRPPAQQVRLHDGSQFGVNEIGVSSQAASIVHPTFGSFEVPRSAVASIRLGKIDSKVESAWSELLNRETRDDLVVIRKGDALDFVDGVISGIDDESVRLLSGGSPFPVPRKNVFGIVFATSSKADSTPVGRLDLVSGGQAIIDSITLKDDAFAVRLVAGPELMVPSDDVARIDFSLGKVLFLADAEPTDVTYPTDHELFLLDVWKYRKGRNSYNDPLQVGRKTYPHGLWIHSGTTLRYRLNREYRHFRAVAGIAGGIGDTCKPSVGLVIRGDGRELSNLTISRGDEVRDLDIDLTGVRELEIDVTSTDPDGVCEHLGLGDARVIK